MSNCEHNLELLSDFLDGTLDAGRSVDLSAHLDFCSNCRAEYHALKNTIGILQSTSVPDGARAKRRALANLRSVVLVEAAPARRALSGFRFAAGALAAATLAAITIQLGPHGQFDPNVTAPQIAAIHTGSHSLPSAFELDEMASLHAVHSFAVAAGDAGDQQETLADATSRLH